MRKSSLGYPYNAIEDLIGNSPIPFEPIDDIRGKKLTPDQMQGFEVALSSCFPREQEAFLLRYKKGKNLKDVGAAMGVTQERARQIINKTLRKLRNPGRFNRILYGNEAYLEMEKEKEEKKKENEALWEKEQKFEKTKLYFSPRVYNALKRAKKNTVKDVLEMSEEGFTKVCGIGVQSLNEIFSKILYFKEQCGEDLEEFSLSPFFVEIKEKPEKEKDSPSSKKEKRVMLVKTDGYSISSWIFENYEEGKKEMDKQYSSFEPEDLEEEWAEMSYCESHDAILYNNGEDVYVWKIVELN